LRAIGNLLVTPQLRFVLSARACAGAIFDAAMAALLVALVLARMTGALAFAADGAFALHHFPAYAVAALVGVPSAWASWRVFCSALDWELTMLDEVKNKPEE